MNTRNALFLVISIIIASCSGNTIDEGVIKSSLVGHSLNGKQIKALSEIKEFEVLSETTAGDLAEYKVKLLLEDVKDQRKNYVEVLLTFKLVEEKWQLEKSNVLNYESDVVGGNIDEVESKAKPGGKNAFLIGKWEGNLGNKKLLIVIEHQDEKEVSGYNVVGSNKRALKGYWTNEPKEDLKSKKPNVVDLSAYYVELNESGDDKWDGSFSFNVGVYSDQFYGNGKWQPYNGQKEKVVKLEKK